MYIGNEMATVQANNQNGLYQGTDVYKMSQAKLFGMDGFGTDMFGIQDQSVGGTGLSSGDVFDSLINKAIEQLSNSLETAINEVVSNLTSQITDKLQSTLQSILGTNMEAGGQAAATQAQSDQTGNLQTQELNNGDGIMGLLYKGTDTVKGWIDQGVSLAEKVLDIWNKFSSGGGLGSIIGNVGNMFSKIF